MGGRMTCWQMSLTRRKKEKKKPKKKKKHPSTLSWQSIQCVFYISWICLWGFDFLSICVINWIKFMEEEWLVDIGISQ